MVLLSWGMTSPGLAHLAYYNLFIVEGETPTLYQLQVLPNGQVVDPHLNYPLAPGGFFLAGSLGVTTDYQFLLIAGGGGIDRFKIQSNGNLLPLGITTSSNLGSIAITLDKQLAIVATMSGPSMIYSFTSSGDLVNETSGPPIANPRMDPLGRGILARDYGDSFSSFTINYVLQSLDSTTTFLTGTNVSGFQFTHNGKLGFIYGVDATPEGFPLGVMKIGPNFTISTTQIFNRPVGVFDVEVSWDNKYFWTIDGICYCIRLFSIDTLGVVTDTGIGFSVPSVVTMGGTIPDYIRLTPEGQLMIVYYDDGSLNPQGGSFATAWINEDGTLTWTGFSFPFDTYYFGNVSVTDFVIVPVYTTDVPEELWGKLDEN